MLCSNYTFVIKCHVTNSSDVFLKILPQASHKSDDILSFSEGLHGVIPDFHTLPVVEGTFLPFFPSFLALEGVKFQADALELFVALDVVELSSQLQDLVVL